MRLRPHLAAFAGLVAVACGGSPLGPVVVPPGADVRTAPATANLAGQALTLEAYPWRDFQPGPGSSPDGRPLIVSVRVQAAGGAAVDGGVRADTMWVVYGDQAWVAPAVREQPRAATAPDLEVVARGGPMWGPGAYVDVVVRLRDASGRAVLLRAPNQLIHRTD